jgi:hypothetical protein
MSKARPNQGSDGRDRFGVAVLVAALLLHLGVALWGWDSTSLVHNGFREAQTAISAHFIQAEGNYSLAYPTPVLGPPWSIPMEFPLYQWTVATLTFVTGMELIQAGKFTGLLCFYLTLPAFALLLGRLGLERWQRHVLLAIVVSCPLYLFYPRAFLIETMALMFSAWFLYGYVRTGETRRGGWALLCLAAGVLAALVKVTTFLFFLLPAACWSLWWIWRDLRMPGGGGWAAVVRRAAWCAPVGLLPLVVALVWIGYADAVKSASPVSAFLQSENLREFNYGFGRRFAADTWAQHIDIWFDDLVTWPVLGVWVLLAFVFARRWWRHLLILLGCFMAVQVIFPLLYAFHAYYYVANAWTLMMAVGLVAVALLDSRLPRLVSGSAVTILIVAQVAVGLAFYAPRLAEEEPGNRELLQALQEATGPEEVLVVAGDDWSSVIPFGARRRALMLRAGMENNGEYLDAAFAGLKGYTVGALVVKDELRTHAGLIARARDQLMIDGRRAFSWGNVDVYLAQGRRDPFVAGILDGHRWPEIEVDEWQKSLIGREVAIEEIPRRYGWMFAGIDPLPLRYFTEAPLARYEQERRSFFDAQPPKRLTFRLPAGKHVFRCEIGILPGAYDESIPHGDRTDGIHVVVTANRPGSEPRVIFTQEINPRDRYDQRGLLKLKHEFTLDAEAEVVFSVNAGPRNNAARDWTIMGPLSFR